MVWSSAASSSTRNSAPKIIGIDGAGTACDIAAPNIPRPAMRLRNVGSKRPHKIPEAQELGPVAQHKGVYARLRGLWNQIAPSREMATCGTGRPGYRAQKGALIRATSSVAARRQG